MSSPRISHSIIFVYLCHCNPGSRSRDRPRAQSHVVSNNKIHGRDCLGANMSPITRASCCWAGLLRLGSGLHVATRRTYSQQRHSDTTLDNLKIGKHTRVIFQGFTGMVQPSRHLEHQVVADQCPQ